MKIKIDFVVRVIFSLVFLFSGIMKILSFDTFVYSVESYDILSKYYVLYFSILIVVLEILVGIMSLFSIYPKVASVLAICVLTGFTLFVSWSVLLEKGFVCNCFGEFFGSKITYLTIIRNLVLLAIAVYLFFSSSQYLIIDHLTKKQSIAVISTLFVLFCSLAFYNGYMMDNKKIFILNKAIDDFKIVTTDNYIVDSKKKTKPFTLLVFFDTRDCPKCLVEAILWKKLNKDYSEYVEVVGIVAPRKMEEINAFIRQKNLKISLTIDYDYKWYSKYNFISPLRVLLNKDNVVIHLERPNGMLTNQDDFMKYLLSKIENNKAQSLE